MSDNFALTDPVPVVKLPAESLTVAFEFAGKLRACEELSAASSLSIVEGSTGITLGSAVDVTFDTAKAVAYTRVSGGASGQDSLVQMVVSTNQNNTLARNVRVQVRDK